MSIFDQNTKLKTYFSDFIFFSEPPKYFSEFEIFDFRNEPKTAKTQVYFFLYFLVYNQDEYPGFIKSL